MKNYISTKILLFTTLFLIVLISVLDVFYPEEDPNRYLVVYPQALLLAISLVFVVKTFTSKCIEITGFHYSLLFFMVMLVLYGLFSPQLNKLPVMLYAVTPFFLFYYATYEGHLQHKHIQIMAVILTIIYAYEIYLGIFERTEKLAMFFSKPDNTGYSALYLIPLFALNLKNTKNIFFISVAFLLVLLSFKRGAMFMGAIAYILAIFFMVLGKKDFLKIAAENIIKVKFAVIVLSAIIIFGVIEYWDIIIYRFLAEKTVGSGREIFYRLIYNAWLEADWINQLFGFGFFEVPELLSWAYGAPLYAHSDWLELLYDHGIIGLSIYSILLIAFLKNKNKVKLYSPDLYPAYLMALWIWLLRSLVGGVYINKDSLILFLAIGFILGTTYKNKNNAYSEPIPKLKIRW